MKIFATTIIVETTMSIAINCLPPSFIFMTLSPPHTTFRLYTIRKRSEKTKQNVMLQLYFSPINWNKIVTARKKLLTLGSSI